MLKGGRDYNIKQNNYYGFKPTWGVVSVCYFVPNDQSNASKVERSGKQMHGDTVRIIQNI